MFGMKGKGDWSLDIYERYFTIGDYAGGEARWCPGCGDHSILTVVQRVCRDAQLLPEKTVCVSGIGCSSRLPHYMGTYGLHGLHGRALPLACGVKSRRPDLDVWVATGDGDCFSIGAAHWIHAVRYNMNLTVLIFDNAVYGLTKMQSSPTSPQGLRTNTHPRGAVLPSMNPLTITLGISNISFLAQVVDWNMPLLYQTIKAAHQHRGLSMVRIVQRCPVFVKDICKQLQSNPDELLLLRHKNGIQIDDQVANKFPNVVEHDPAELNQAFAIAADTNKVPVGLLYRNPDVLCYEDLSSHGIGMSNADKIAGINSAMDTFAI